MMGSKDKVSSSTAERDPPPRDVMPAVDPVDLKRRRRVWIKDPSVARHQRADPRETLSC